MICGTYRRKLKKLPFDGLVSMPIEFRSTFARPSSRVQARKLTTSPCKIQRITFWCSEEAAVHKAHSFFCSSLNCKSFQDAKLQYFGALGLSKITSSVRLADVEIEFLAIPYVSKLRRKLLLPNCNRLLRVHLKPSRESKSEVSNSHSANRKRELAHLLSLSFSSNPVISPEIIIDKDCTEESLISFSDEGKNNHITIKEVAIGVDDTHISKATEILRSTAGREILPGFASYLQKGEKLETALRIIPSPYSTLVLKVEDCNQFKADLAVEHNIKLTTIGRNGMSRGDYSLEIPLLNGIDVRISDSPDHLLHFYETPESSQKDAVDFGGRNDMGQMSCVSVVGMEAKHRMFGVPANLINRVSRLLAN